MRVADTMAAVAYHSVAKRLPASTHPGGRAWRNVRSTVARRMLGPSAHNINIERGATFGHRKLVRIGERSGIGIDCHLFGAVEIGAGVMMGPEVLIYASTHAYGDVALPMIDQGRGPERPVIIEDDVWIGARTIILPGVRVGHGSIIGAGSVVTRDVPPYSVFAGNPGRVVRDRRSSIAR